MGSRDGSILPLKETITTAESQFVMLAGKVPVTFKVIPTGGSTGKVQTTTSPPADVIAGTAEWDDWALGVVDVKSQDASSSPLTAAKLVKSTGASLAWEVVA